MRSLVKFVIVGLGWAGLTAGADEAPGLPAGHPPVAPQQQKDQPAGLPAGHPQLPGGPTAPGALPAGHPQLPGAGGAQPGGLPAGHPQLPGAAAGGLPAGHPPTLPVRPSLGAKGSLTVRAVQASKGGPAVGADAVLVEYYNADGNVVGKTQATLSADKGEVTIKDVALDVPVQPLITVTHAGIEYKAPGNVMDAGQHSQAVEVSVFEATADEPAWQVRMRHVIVEPAREGLKVTDMISVYNPTDRAWTGKAPAGGGKAVTLSLALPDGATNVKAGGAFHECCVKFEGGRVVYSMAMLPGAADYQLHYVIPAGADGAATVSIAAPAPTGSLFVFLPDDGTTVTSDALKPVAAKAGAKLRANSRFFTAAPQKPGETLKFTVGGLGALKASAAGPESDDAGRAAGTTPDSAGIPHAAKVAGGVVAGAVLTVGSVVIFCKSPKAAKA